MKLFSTHRSVVDILLAIGLLVIGLAAHAERTFEPPISVASEVNTFVVNADGTYAQTIEDSIRIKTSQGVERYGSRQVSYIPGQEKIRSIEAWTLQPDGARIPVLPSAIRERDEDNSGGASKFTDTKYMFMVFPQVQVGSLLGYKVKTDVHVTPYPGEFHMTFVFRGNKSYENWEANIVVPESRKLHIDHRGVSGGLEKTMDGLSYYRFRYSRNNAVPGEDGAAGDIHHSDYLFVSTIPDMTALGRIANTFFQPNVEVSEEIGQLAAKLTEGHVGEREKAKAVYLWVTRNIRYVAIALLDGRLVPHRASEVLANRYGDCKDHVVLLESLLAAVGINSSPAMINAGPSYIFSKIGVHYPINHVITYLPSLDLYLDSTDRFAAFGTLPYPDMDKPVVLTALGRLGRTPRMKAEEHATRANVYMAIQPDGSIKGRSEAIMTGFPENSSRAERFDRKSESEESVVKGLLYLFNETGSGSIDNPDPEDLESPFWVRTRFTLDPVSNMPGRGALAVPVGLAPGEIASGGSNKPLVERKLPYYCKSRLVEERYLLQFPATMAIEDVPKGTIYRRGGIHYQSSFRLDGRKVAVERRLHIQRDAPLCGPKDHSNWLAFHKALQRDLRAQIFYRQAARP